MKRIITVFLMIFTLVFASACSCKKDDGLTTEQYSEAFNALAETLMKKEAVSLLGTSLGYVDSSESADRNYLAVGAYIIFLREAVKNENFTILDNGVGNFTSTARFNALNEVQEMPMSGSIKVEFKDGKIRSDLIQLDPEDGEMHMLIDIEYDFEKTSLKSFDLYIRYSISDTEYKVNHYKGDGTSISVLEDVKDEYYANAEAFIASRKTAIEEGLETAKDIGDYSEEYTIAMIEQTNFVFGDGFATPIE